MQTARPCRGLVLAGGGARGSYQVGVWRALDEMGWTAGVVTGTSVGCLNGAIYVLGQYEGRGRAGRLPAGEHRPPRPG